MQASHCMFKNMDWVESALSQVDPASVADDKVQTRKEPIETISHQIKKLMEASRVKKKDKKDQKLLSLSLHL